tara:strand:- start:930 stop:1529 length:600 start_codon:yes stop_codon:yes gene_type:complete
LGVFLDFFDGFFARYLKVENEFGIQLDSMADLITSGLAPTLILFNLINANEKNLLIGIFEVPFSGISLISFLVVIFAAIRLANFNIDKKQKNFFIGLPAPMSAIFIASLPLIESSEFYSIYSSTVSLCIITIGLSILMVSKIKLFSMKLNFKENISSQINATQLSMLIFSLLLILFFNLAAIPFIVVLYILLSIIKNIL